MEERTLVDDKPMVVRRGEQWCCMLCKRQFDSEEKLGKHMSKSSLHAENLTAARLSGRLRELGKVDGRRPLASARGLGRCKLGLGGGLHGRAQPHEPREYQVLRHTAHGVKTASRSAMERGSGGGVARAA